MTQLTVCSVGGEEEGRQHSSSGQTHIFVISHAVVCLSDSHRPMWRGENPHVLHVGLQQLKLDGVEGAGEVKEHDTGRGVGSIQGAVGLLQQVDDCIIDPIDRQTVRGPVMGT